MSPMLSNLSVWWYQNAVRVPWISSIFLGILFGILFTLLSIRAARRFDFLIPVHPELDRRKFWSALLKGGIQAAIYISDSI